MIESLTEEESKLHSLYIGGGRSKSMKAAHAKYHRIYRRSTIERNKSSLSYSNAWKDKTGYRTSEKKKRMSKDWSDKNREKTFAHDKVAAAIKNKVLIRPETCQRCEEKLYTEAHHPDYSKPLCVMWLCKSCHQLEHSKVK